MTGNGDDRDPDRVKTSEGDLSGRLDSLGDKLRQKGGATPSSDGEGGRVGGAAGAGLALAFRLSSEFIAGILAGAVIGWGIDYFAGTGPWGMIVFLLLGFAAGVLNVIRSAGLLGDRSGK